MKYYVGKTFEEAKNAAKEYKSLLYAKNKADNTGTMVFDENGTKVHPLKIELTDDVPDGALDKNEDGTTKVYKLIINALPDNVNLLNVKVNGKVANAVPVNKYEARVNKNDTSFELYVIPEDEKAKVQIENNIEVTGTASATISKDTEEVGTSPVTSTTFTYFLPSISV